MDIALVKLEKPIHNIKPAEIYEGEVLPYGSQTKAYGWGRAGFAWKPKLQTKTGKIVSAPHFNTSYEVNELDGNTKIIPGDSGGPIFYDGKLYGAVSGTPSEKIMYEDIFLLHQGTRTAYTTVSNEEVKIFIENTIGKSIQQMNNHNRRIMPETNNTSSINHNREFISIRIFLFVFEDDLHYSY